MPLLEDRRFYTYIYLNPLKPGKYTYEGLDRGFLFEPFYVGKGQGRRMYDHVNESKRVTNRLIKHNIIRKILQNNQQPIIFRLRDNLTSREAGNLEIEYIAAIGRINMNTGCLANLTDGGDGIVGLSGEAATKRIENYKKTLEENPDINKIRGKSISETRKLFTENKWKAIHGKYFKHYIDDPNKKLKENEKRKQTLKNNPEIQKQKTLKAQQTIANRTEEERQYFSNLSREKANQTYSDPVKKEKILNKRNETIKNNSQPTLEGIEKSRITQIQNKTSLGSNNSNYKKIDIHLFLTCFFKSFGIVKTRKLFNSLSTTTISSGICQRIFKIYLIPNWERHLQKEGKQKRKNYVEYYQNKIDSLVNIYKPLEDIYYLNKNKKDHPELNLDYSKEIQQILYSIERDKKDLIESLIYTKNFY